MKRLLRAYLIQLAALKIAEILFAPAFKIGGGLTNYLLAAGIFSLLSLLLKPILKLLFLPINIVTMGLFSLVINALVFYLFLQLVPSITILSWTFPGISSFGVYIPAVQLNFCSYLVE